MYETTSSDTASFKILFGTLKWQSEAPEFLPDQDLGDYYEKHLLLSDIILEAGLYRRKASLMDRILAIAERVPDEEWKKVPADLAERYRDYKRNIGE